LIRKEFYLTYIFQMPESQHIFSFTMTYTDRVFRATSILVIIASFFSCNTQSAKDTTRKVDTQAKDTPDSLHFIAHITVNNGDGSKYEADTITGYRKYYYPNGKLQMEGKVTDVNSLSYRDGIWNYYNDSGQLMKQETSNKEGKVNELDFKYFKNGKLFSKTYQYYEGDYTNKSTFRFHKIETLYYTNGKDLAERHWINNSLVEEKCWDSMGNPKPIEYLMTLTSVEVED
jgi:antitoxin component YwqK of YwqJK toxin-antitoxin module